jgi:hypothetical protein
MKFLNFNISLLGGGILSWYSERIMLVKPEGKRMKGRPRIRWMDGVENDLRDMGMVYKI